ncbi:MAG: DNA alkylation repair protein [Lachnospiraceae bacterium]|nr:DNA alkylation repair protein [Lachnospiraceae bacterium]
MIIKEIREALLNEKDVKYKDFQGSLIPGVEAEYFIGVRTPRLRAMAKEYAKNKDIQKFLDDLPHKYFDENQLHAFIISGMKDYDKCVEELEKFLPYVDNWATCDQMIPGIFKKHKKEILPLTDKWMKSGETYSIRFGIKMLMEHFLDDDFDIKYAKKVSKVKSEEYYVKMMVAWYMATALAKQYDAVLPIMEDKKMEAWTHNKAIQKAVESFRVTDEHKNYLKTLKIK